MKVGILTFYRVANFGANLQALSTYCYLKSNGHEPWFINYYDRNVYRNLKNSMQTNIQVKKHIEFVDNNISNQSNICFNDKDVNNEIKRLGIEAVLVGSDAVLQHHPFISRIHRGKRKPFYIEKISTDRMFPNVFWGVGVDHTIPKAMMSASSQNSEYKFFSNKLKGAMAKALNEFRMITVRDNWTKQLISCVTGKDISIKTPDPVFGLNYTAKHLIPSKEEIIKEFHLPQKYVLVSLFSQVLSEETLMTLRDKFHESGIECVALTMPTGINFKHKFKYEIRTPLSSIHWYALIKYAYAYVGSNMHPIVVCLHNAVPCYSIDNWGTKNFWNIPKNDGSSKVFDILRDFDVTKNHCYIVNGKANLTTDDIINRINSFPIKQVEILAQKKLDEYLIMMKSLLEVLGK